MLLTFLIRGCSILLHNLLCKLQNCFVCKMSLLSDYYFLFSFLIRLGFVRLDTLMLLEMHLHLFFATSMTANWFNFKYWSSGVCTCTF